MRRTISSAASLGWMAFAALVLLALPCAWLPAQEDPFGEEGKAPKAGKKAKGGDDTAKTKSRAPLNSRTGDGAAALAILESNPATPEKRIEAATLLFGLGQPDYARDMIEPLAATPPTGEQAASLVRKFGGGLFMRWIETKELDPEGTTLAVALLDASAAYARDPANIDQAIQSLTKSAAEARKARENLRESGVAAIPALAAVLADDGRATEHVAVRGALLDFGHETAKAVVPWLASTTPRLRAEAALLIGRSAYEPAAPYLAGLASSGAKTDDARAARWALKRLGGDAPSKVEAEIFLRARLREALDDRRAAKIDFDEPVRVWRWSDADRTLSEQVMMASDERRERAVRLATALTQAAPGDASYARRLLAARLAYDYATAGRQAAELPARKDAKAAGVDVVEAALVDAIELENIPAAIACCELLGELGKPELLTRSGAALSPLAQAMRHVDRRVRRAATDAVMRIDSPVPFAGAGAVVQNLEHFLATRGVRRVLIGHGSAEEASRMASMFDGIGYEADFVTTGKKLFQAATATSDYEMILVSETIDHWHVLETLHWLRRDRRTYDIPIAVVESPLEFDAERYRSREYAITPEMAKAPPVQKKLDGRSGFVTTGREVEKEIVTDLDLTKRLKERPKTQHWGSYAVEQTPLSVLVASPAGTDGADYIARTTRRLKRGSPLTIDEQMDDAHWAVDWAYKLCGDRETRKFHEFVRLEKPLEHAIRVPELAARSAKCLARIGTHESQTTLLDQASSATLDLSDRQVAADAFAESVATHGILLTRRQIQQQFDRYNASENEPEETQELLGKILDAIEARGNNDSLVIDPPVAR